MSDLPRLPLADFFQLLKPTHVLGTTFTLSLAFFEATVLPKIDRSLLRRCVLLTDQHGFQSSLVEAGALRSVGRDYQIMSVPCKGTFHPKVWILVGEAESAVLVGSGNLTRSGFMDNAELFDSVHLVPKGPHRTVADGLATFLDGLRTQWGSKVGDGDLPGLDALLEMREHLVRLSNSMLEDPYPKVRFLSNYAGPLIDQLPADSECGVLYVAAPYFGGSVSGLERLRTRLKPKKVKVFPAVHEGQLLDVPLERLKDLPGVTVHSLALAGNQFAHLKLYGADSQGGPWLLTTSANCTLEALSGENVEAGLLRKVSKTTLRSYFEVAADTALPTKLRDAAFTNGSKWLSLSASDRGSTIHLVASCNPEFLPLREVKITVSVAGDKESTRRSALFKSAPTEPLPWELFPIAARRKDWTPLLTVNAISNQGSVVVGAAFIDQPLLLSSEPTHRGAWRATLALLDEEGQPDGADLACVFHLFGEVFDGYTSASAASQSNARSEGASPATSEEEDKIAIWPPVTHAMFSGGFRHSHSHPVQWFQRILSGLMLVPSESADSRSVSGSYSAESDDEVAEVDRIAMPSRLAKGLWRSAGSSFEGLLKRLATATPTTENARKLWPVSIAIFLVTQATRRQLVTNLSDQELPSSLVLVEQFLRGMFGDRFLPGRHRMMETDHNTDGSIATELHERFGAAPSDDIADVVFLLLAFQHAHVGETREFMKHWLAFRAISLNERWLLPVAGSETLFRRYLDAPGGVTWDQVVASLKFIPTLNWSHHSGYCDLHALTIQASAGASVLSCKFAYKPLQPSEG